MLEEMQDKASAVDALTRGQREEGEWLESWKADAFKGCGGQAGRTTKDAGEGQQERQEAPGKAGHGVWCTGAGSAKGGSQR